MIYDSGKRLIASGSIERHGLSVMLVGSGYIPSRTDSMTDVVDEITSDGYERKTLSNVRFTCEDGMMVLRADEVVWPKSNIEARAAVFCSEHGLVRYYDLGQFMHSRNHDFVLSFPSGILGF